MNYNEAMQYIHSIARFGSKLGLERVKELLNRLGNPQKQTRFVHVAGTNGKGSTVTMLAEILTAAGYRTGKYTSPYVFDFRERIAIDGNMIDENALCSLTERISAVCIEMKQDGYDDVTEFEFITAMGFCYFAEQKCDVVVLEVGLGGRFDATNVIDAPLLSVITTLALDHTAILGDTIGQIAFEKGGIIKTSSPVIVYPTLPDGALQTISEIAAERRCQLTIPKIDELEILKCDLSGNRFLYRGLVYEQRLLGEYQIYNALVVLEAINALRHSGLAVSYEAVCRGMAHCRMPARFDMISSEPLVILDAGHNPQGIDALTDLMDKMKGRHIRVVFAVMSDKEYSYAITQLSRRASVFFAVTLRDFPRALCTEHIVSLAKEYCPVTRAFPDVEAAIETALADIGDDCLLICGSFYLMEQAMSALKNKGIL